MIKLIAIDLDDTLLNKKKEISSRNVSAINNAVTNNVKIVLATGRPYFRVKPILEKLNLLDDNQVVITLNGGYICNATNNKTLYENVLNNQDIVKIIEVINNTKLCFRKSSILLYKNKATLVALCSRRFEFANEMSKSQRQ